MPSINNRLGVYKLRTVDCNICHNCFSSLRSALCMRLAYPACRCRYCLLYRSSAAHATSRHNKPTPTGVYVLPFDGTRIDAAACMGHLPETHFKTTKGCSRPTFLLVGLTSSPRYGRLLVRVDGTLRSLLRR